MAEEIFNERAMREEICDIGRRIWQREYVAANDGNISVRLSEREILATPTGVSKGFLTPDMMVVIDRQGNKLRGHMKPSSELKMHRAFYDARPDVRSVCHAHPIVATGFAVAGIGLDRCTLPEVVITLGSVPLAKYGVPGSDELTQDIMENYVKDFDAFLLANHGVVTIGPTLMNAYYKMETVEHFAKISLVARLLGGENVLAREEVTRLQELRGTYGITAPAPICADGSTAPPSDQDPATCQIIQSPASPGTGGARLIPTDPTDLDGEIRLSYRELTALIEDAVKALLGGQHG